jgi:hypothetical protein
MNLTFLEHPDGLQLQLILILNNFSFVYSSYKLLKGRAFSNYVGSLGTAWTVHIFSQM